MLAQLADDVLVVGLRPVEVALEGPLIELQLGIHIRHFHIGSLRSFHEVRVDIFHVRDGPHVGRVDPRVLRLCLGRGGRDLVAALQAVQLLALGVALPFLIANLEQ